MALTSRLQVLASPGLIDDFEAWTATIEAVSVGDMLRRAIHLLARMTEAGLDTRRDFPPERRNARVGMHMSTTTMGHLQAAAHPLAMSLSQTCCLAFLWYKDVGQAQLDAVPFTLRSARGEVDCTRLLLP